MSNASDQRIRHVAIVLQSLDANTSRGLLAQLPPEQSKRVRQAMVQMGTVTPNEREAAFQSMQGLLKAANIRVGTERRKSNEAISPAAALLASQKMASSDQIEFSSEAFQPDPVITDEFYSATATRNDGHWHHMPAEALADILQAERPIVIATVLNQVSVERATAISQALPLHIAAATLAALPHLHLTDSAIIRDIQTELERKIGQYQAPKQANAEGLAKLQAIVASMPASQQSNWTTAIAQSNPVLATKLGWTSQTATPTATPTALNATPQHTSKQSANLSSIVEVSDHFKNQPSNLNKPQNGDAQSIPIDIFEDATILPFPGSSNTPRSDVSEPKQQVAPKLTSQNLKQQTLNDLLHFSDRDFVAVLHACQPQTVLLALSGATKSFVARVERLMPSKDVKRLRNRLSTLGPIQLRDVDVAQSAIVETAMKMLASGTIAEMASVSFTAAA